HGFELCRFAEPEIAPKFSESLDRWLEQGFQADMDWMAEAERAERRKSPERMLDDIKTVITVAMRYTPPSYILAEAEAARGRGVMATYAHGDDYHEVMKKRLKRLARALDALLGPHEQRVYVDTAPVLEHALAESSGLGWQGKHSLTINRKQGSWFLLGEIFTTADIEPDEPAINHCGTCMACMDICPTGAIVAPYVVDARLCISYLTIEFRGFIPRDLRPLMGNRIFGCDDCQMVCPWNRHATAPDSDFLNPRGENILPELASLMRLDDEAFRARFRKSPVRRTGRAGLLRNVAIAIGNSGDSNHIPLLLRAMHDDEPLIRGHAAWGLEQLCDHANAKQVLDGLQRAGAVERDKNALEDIDLSIQYIKENI
ncbi:MAG: tRNA epoxyqueuosine(34) reductase QueG, partial [Mariprofundaceae bacterium]|nr:tRNA epoxyqueuosine(34) reductase QueG [Mariprofundaceae bacterium]